MFRMILLLFSFELVVEATTNDSLDDAARIVEGWNVPIEKAPYQVSVQRYRRHVCGGSLIHRRYVLTAAHCVRAGDMRTFSVKAGVTFLEEPGFTARVSNISKHPDFSYEFLRYDIAVLQLRRRVTESPKIKVYPLSALYPTSRIRIIVTGWGAKFEDGLTWDRLQMTELDVMPFNFCQTIYAGIKQLTDEMFCASYLRTRRDTCAGDSGGPAVYDNKIIGVVSFGKGCGTRRYPSVFSSVAKSKKWIKKVIRESQEILHALTPSNRAT